MSRWDFECTLRDVRDRLRPDYDSLFKAMECVAENWVDMEKSKKALEEARAELETAKSELAEVRQEFEELKRERPVEVPDEGCACGGHNEPRCHYCSSDT